MRLLITGASGLLGSKLTELSINKGYETYSGYHNHKPLNGIPIKYDLSIEAKVEEAFKKAKPEAVIHTAALTNVDECEAKKELAWKINAIGTKNVAKLSKKYNAFLIYISTDYIFKGDKGMYREDDEPSPVNYYGLTKLKGKEAVKELTDEYCIARSSVIYGATPATGKTNFALWLIEKMRRRERVKIVADQWNSPTLDTNLAEMLLEILDRGMTGTYHLAGATRMSRYEFAKLIAETFNLNGDLITPAASDEISWRAKRPMDSSLNVSKAANTLRNRPLEAKSAIENLKRELEPTNTASTF